MHRPQPRMEATGLTAGNRRLAVFVVMIVMIVGVNVAPGSPAAANHAALPVGFVARTVATNLINPVGMEIGPDGRVYVLAGRSERRVDVIEDDVLSPTPYLRLPQVLNMEQGLNGLTWHPDFANNPYVYVSYLTAQGSPQRFELARYTVVSGSPDTTTRQIIFSVPDQNPSQQLHQGGDIAFGPDGKLYWVLGDRVMPTTSQDLTRFGGKVLRINPDGTIPTDNPYYGTLSGDLRAVYARGLRNPWRIERHPVTAELYISDVGSTDWEEINRVQRDANYGWPTVTGPGHGPTYTDPVWAYEHFDAGGNHVGCAVSGGGVYPTGTGNFPSALEGRFFVGDHCYGWIDAVDLATGTSERFATGTSRLTEVKAHPTTGALYFLDREYEGDTDNASGGVGRIDFESSDALAFVTQPSDTTVSIGQDAAFDALATGTGVTYQWRRGGESIAGATNASYTIAGATLADDGATLDVVVTDGTGASLTSNPAVLTVLDNTPPTARIDAPTGTESWKGGDTIAFAGSAEDAEDGALGPAAMEWRIVYHHDDHTHPYLDDITGVDSGTFDLATSGETAANVWYRIHLVVTDGVGASSETFVDIFPVTTILTFDSSPSGLEIVVDGLPLTTPVTLDGVAGIDREVGAFDQTAGGTTYTFESWSDGGPAEHTVSTPSTPTTFVATFTEGPTVDAPPTIVIDEPVPGARVPAPVTVSGRAADDVGVDRVNIEYKLRGAQEWWNGSTWQPTKYSFFQDLTPTGVAGEVAWTSTPDLPAGVSVQISALVRDTAGQASYVQQVLHVSSQTVDEPPTVAVTAPERNAVEPGPVVIAGSASDDIGLSKVAVVIKQTGATRWWDGNGWVSTWTQIPVHLGGTKWHYRFDPGAAVRVRVYARAVDTGGNKVATASFPFDVV